MIVAVDFDGVLVEDQFPGIGKTDAEMVEAVKLAIEAGHEAVLWTCRVDDKLSEAVACCEYNGLRFCAVNDNAPSNKAKYSKQFPNGTRKVYADYYIDDHGVGYNRGAALEVLDYLRRTKA